MTLLRVKGHLSRFLALYVVLAIVAGYLAGNAVILKGHQGRLKALNMLVVILMILPIVILMILPMMITLQLAAMKRAVQLVKPILIALGMGLILSPLLMALFIWATGLVHPVSAEFAVGLMLAVVVPCSSMAIAYTFFSKGNIELATIIVTLSFALAVIVVPLWRHLFASAYSLNISVMLLLKTIAIVLVAPMLLGIITQRVLLKRLGADGFKRPKPLFPAISLVGMFLIVFLIFMEKARLISSRLLTTAFALLPLLSRYLVSLLALTRINRAAGLSYADHMAVAFSSLGKNEGTAMAIAMTAGLGMVAVPPAVAPILQIPVLVAYVKLASRLERAWPRRHEDPPIPEP